MGLNLFHTSAARYIPFLPTGTISLTLFNGTPENTLWSIASGVCQPTATAVSPLQPEKALSPILVTLPGIAIEVSPLHPEKAPPPILVTLLGILIDVSPLQPEKALSPILVTLFGIFIELSPLQPEKA